MMQEIERPKFRPGENANKLYGGKVSDDPLSQALYKSALSRGFESQRALAKALGISFGTVGRWYSAEHVPSPDVFGDLIVLLDPTDDEREPLVEAYANNLAERDKNSKLKISRILMRPSNAPLSRWIEDFCKERNITINQFSQMLGFNNALGGKRRNSLGFDSLEQIRQNAKDKLGLSEDQTINLNEVINSEIQQRQEKGHRFQSGLSGGSQVIKKQKELSYRTYNGHQAANELGISRESVSKLRRKFNLPLLLIDEHIETLRAHLEKTRTSREKWQQATRKKKIKV